jgi:predicted metalloprotease with PDZ domain
MLHYKLYVKNPSSHYLYVDLLISGNTAQTMRLQLPSWRPGRYELGNFARNIKKFEAFDGDDGPLHFRKISKDCWEILTKRSKQIKVTYSYYSADLNAGSTFVNEEQVYVNPCNCLMFVPEMMQTEHKVTLDVPDQYFIASSLKREHKTLIASNYDELADSPFFASAHVKTSAFIVNDIQFYLHFQGECHPNTETLVKDFSAFISEQLAFFKGVHFSEYHFLFQILPSKFHHGVEHTKNTVIAFGPGYHLMHEEVYNEFLGLCCHEFFHTWNIKTIRPAEMYPYDYTRENYARTGFVYEGVTTYYGDKLLLTSGVFKEETYFKTLEERITKHLHSFGRFNLSVGDSSFDNWLDGYTPGAPYRKTNIYDEGCLIAFMLDVLILKHSDHKNSLRTALNDLYENIYKKNKGYTEEDFTHICSEAAGTSLHDFFQKYVYGLEPYEPLLEKCFHYIGLEPRKHHASGFYERYLGIKAVEHLHHKKVTLVAPYSPAWKAGISIGDEIMAVEGFILKNDLHQWLHYFSQKQESCELTIIRGQELKRITVPLKAEGDFFYTYKIVHREQATEEEKKSYEIWKRSFQR